MTYKTAQPRAIKGWTLIHEATIPFTKTSGTKTFYYQKDTPSKACALLGWDAQIRIERYYTDSHWNSDGGTRDETYDDYTETTSLTTRYIYANRGNGKPFVHDFNDGRGMVINIGAKHVYSSKFVAS